MNRDREIATVAVAHKLAITATPQVIRILLDFLDESAGHQAEVEKATREERELLDAASDLLNWHMYPNVKGDDWVVSGFAAAALRKPGTIWKGWVRMKDAVHAIRSRLTVQEAGEG